MKVNMIDGKQRKAIWAASKAKGLSHDDLYSLIYTISKKEHMSDLTYTEAAKILSRLNNKKEESNNTEYVPGKISPAQMSMIYNLASIAGWDIIMLNKHILKKYNVQIINWLSRSQASSLIETLKWVIKQRGSGELGKYKDDAECK